MIIDLSNYKVKKQQEKYEREQEINSFYESWEQLIEEKKVQDQKREQEIIKQYKEFYKEYNQNII